MTGLASWAAPQSWQARTSVSLSAFLPRRFGSITGRSASCWARRSAAGRQEGPQARRQTMVQCT